jgi:hypothetical protein
MYPPLSEGHTEHNTDTGQVAGIIVEQPVVAQIFPPAAKDHPQSDNNAGQVVGVKEEPNQAYFL